MHSLLPIFIIFFMKLTNTVTAKNIFEASYILLKHQEHHIFKSERFTLNDIKWNFSNCIEWWFYSYPIF